MLSILTRDSATQDLEALNEAVQAEVVAPEKPEFEIVLGRLQVASVLFLATVVLVIFSALSYLAGKASAPKTEVSAAETSVPAPPPMIEATITKAPPAKPASAKSEAPIFSEPTKGAVYLQMGAVDEGIAMLLVEGLRKRGFQSFAAPGPTDKIHRVLIGPFADAEGYNTARDAVSQIGVITFARRYQP